MFSLIIETNPNALVVQRTFNTDTFTLVSGIIGTLAGVFGAIGSIMVVSETVLSFIGQRADRDVWLEGLATNREFIKEDQIGNSPIVKVDSAQSEYTMNLV